ncbi:MAG: hypothetical protein A2X08_09455 [Bacteroidetes bacterium GWA2_32_17]|nr:MAG: hypothetical protein A2X08_09455 [Bacteroidetes bacterium GWA2_32_17]
MKKTDFIFILVFCVIVTPFLPFPFLKNFQTDFLYNETQWIWTSFLKFALLATMGEVIGLRIKAGVYLQKGFGLIPRMIVWGFLGITIKIAFVVFASGVPSFIEKCFWIDGVKESMNFKDIFEANAAGDGGKRLLSAFFISAIMNFFYAPVMMTFHKITDIHIVKKGGTLKGFFSQINFVENFKEINWKMQWGFIFKKTIPFFWIPMQTITFSVASEYRVVIAAFLGIVLGVLLSVAPTKSK